MSVEVAPPVLEVRGARRSFGGRAALSGVDLDVRRGEWLALLGPNGAGKTTLLRAVCGRVRLDGGRIDLLGERVDGRPRAGAVRRLGVVPQDLAVYGALTVAENLRTFAAFHGVERRDRDERVAWALRWSGLEDRSDDRAERLSGGMRRRLNIGCGVMHRPAVLLLDEPTVGVDRSSRERIVDMLCALRDDGAALVHSSHELLEVERVTDRVAVLDAGRVVVSGPTRDVIESRAPRSRRVRVVLERELPDGVAGGGLVARGRRIEGRLGDPARDLPDLLARIEAAGGRVHDLHVEAPSLEDAVAAWTARGDRGGTS